MEYVMEHITPAQFEDEMNKIIAEGFNIDRATELMLQVLETNGYSAGVKAFKEAGKHCGMDFCEI